MIKKFLLVSSIVLVLFSVGIAHAAQIDGLANAAGPALPTAGADPLHVYVSPGGLGQVLYYGYYNVRDNKVNFFQVINTDQQSGVVAKVRFREAETIKGGCSNGAVDCGSLEVLDFIVCLSHGDVFTGFVKGDSGQAVLYQYARGTSTGNINNTDTTKTQPSIPATGQPFSTQVTKTVTITKDQTREGYFEVLAYQKWDDKVGTCNFTGTTPDPGLSNLPPDNDIMGVNYILDANTGALNAYKATALADFTNLPHNPTLGNDDYTVLDGRDGFGTASLEAVNYILTKSDIFTTYLIDPTIGAQTELVVTFPTKKFTQTSAQLPNVDIFKNPQVAFVVWDINEHTITPQVGFSPTFVPTNTLPNEVNVLNFFNSKSITSTIFTSFVQGNIDAENTTNGNFDLGWVDLNLTLGAGTIRTTCANNSAPGVSCVTYPPTGFPNSTVRYSLGLPALGIVFTDIANGKQSITVPVGYSNAISDGTGYFETP